MQIYSLAKIDLGLNTSSGCRCQLP